MTFSNRTNWNAAINRLTAARQREGADLLDLTQSNPTRAAIDYPLDELAEVMGRAARASYDPDPRGLISARQALATELGCSADDLLLTASTSEAYAFLFKLLCNPGDEVIAAVPSYPLLEHISGLESIGLRPFALEFHRRWEIDGQRVAQTIGDRTRAILVVNPNNPTGSFVSPEEQEALARLGSPIISDEVFLDYPLEGSGSTFVREDILTFTLGGLSKSAGLPHYKLGWIRVSGPPAARREAMAALELIADSFLSVSTPVQVALPELLPIGFRIRAAIAARIRRNLQQLRAAAAPVRAVHVLPVEGGWSAVLRVPNTDSDEDLALRLIEKDGLLAHPGYFFDFQSNGYLVLSLLTEPDTFDEGVRRLLASLPR
jgi:aspartate/methionine/tyrosine aminotransferase